MLSHSYLPDAARTDGLVPYRLSKLSVTSDYISAMQKARQQRNLEKKRMHVRVMTPSLAEVDESRAGTSWREHSFVSQHSRPSTFNSRRTNNSPNEPGTPNQNDIVIRRSPSSVSAPHSIDAMITPARRIHSPTSSTDSSRLPDFVLETLKRSTSTRQTEAHANDDKNAALVRDSSAKSIHWGLKQSRNQVIDRSGKSRYQGSYSRGLIVHCKAPDSWLRRYRSAEELRKRRYLLPFLTGAGSLDPCT